MTKRLPRLLAALAALLALGACGRTSEAKVHLNNIGALSIKVNIDYLTSTIPAGAIDTVTLTWPGRGEIAVSMAYFPVGQPARARYEDLVLANGQERTFSLGFSN